MKKTLLSLCIMLTAVMGQAFAQNNDVTGNKRFTVSVIRIQVKHMAVRPVDIQPEQAFNE